MIIRRVNDTSLSRRSGVIGGFAAITVSNRQASA
jgi:hypothetical protein